MANCSELIHGDQEAFVLDSDVIEMYWEVHEGFASYEPRAKCIKVPRFVAAPGNRGPFVCHCLPAIPASYTGQNSSIMIMFYCKIACVVTAPARGCPWPSSCRSSEFEVVEHTKVPCSLLVLPIHGLHECPPHRPIRASTLLLCIRYPPSCDPPRSAVRLFANLPCLSLPHAHSLCSPTMLPRRLHRTL